jgi:hypothetical protein
VPDTVCTTWQWLPISPRKTWEGLQPENLTHGIGGSNEALAWLNGFADTDLASLAHVGLIPATSHAFCTDEQRVGGRREGLSTRDISSNVADFDIMIHSGSNLDELFHHGTVPRPTVYRAFE